MSGGHGGGIIIIRSLRATKMLTPEEEKKLSEIESRLSDGGVRKGPDLEAIGHIAKAIAQRP